MRNILILITAAALAATLFSSSARTMARTSEMSDNRTAARSDMGQTETTAADQDSPEAEDSTVMAIAWFCKRDTTTYWINDSEWKYKGTDTVKTTGVYTKVMLTVTDSTRKGYDMEYKFLEFGLDTSANSGLQEVYQQAVKKLQETTVGTTIRFHTDELGVIKKYYNLNEVKKQAKAVISEFVEELPYMDSLSSCGIRTDRLLKMIDSDKITDSYIEEIEMLFQCFGSEYDIGEYRDHSDATDTEYETDTFVSVSLDPETYDYEMDIDIYNHIPKEDLKNLLGTVINIFATEETYADIKSEMDAGFDEQVKDDGILNSFLHASFFADGWPKEVVEQESFRIGDSGKIRQKYIIWVSRSTGNFD